MMKQSGKRKQKHFALLVGMVALVLSSLAGCDGTANVSEPEITSEIQSKENLSKDTNSQKAAQNGGTEQPEGTERNEETAQQTADVGESTLEVHFMDVGQGDATLLSCDGHYMLIDAGNNDKGTYVQNYLQKQGAETLDYVIGTHPDADHIGGLDVVLYKFDCKTVVMPEVSNDTRTYDDVVETMKNKNYQTTYPVVGETYTLGGATFTIVTPNADYGADMNAWSVGILVQNGDNRFLFTGDAEEKAEKDILANGLDISADVYKVAHHGSDTATTEAFLKAVNPTYAVISAGEGNSYGHPHAEVLNRLREAGVQVFRTDEQGTVIAKSDGTKITWNCSPSETWQAGERTGSAKESGNAKESSNATDTDTAEKKESDAVKGAAAGAAGAAVSAVDQNTAADQSTTVNQNAAAETTDNTTDQSTAENVTTQGAVSDSAAQSAGAADSVTVHITETGEKYHSAGCQYLKKSDIEVTLAEAKARGLGPCSKCNPPQ